MENSLTDTSPPEREFLLTVNQYQRPFKLFMVNRLPLEPTIGLLLP